MSAPDNPRAGLVPARSKPSFTTPQPLVTIMVGTHDNLASFVVHKSVITYHSSFFCEAFDTKSGSLENTTQEMKMEDVSPAAFGLFVHWLYTQSFPTGDETPALITLADVWVLGGRFMVSAVKDCAVNTLWASFERVVDEKYIEFVHHIYEADGDVMASLKGDIVDGFIEFQFPLAEEIEMFPAAFARDVLKNVYEAEFAHGFF